MKALINKVIYDVFLHKAKNSHRLKDKDFQPVVKTNYNGFEVETHYDFAGSEITEIDIVVDLDDNEFYHIPKKYFKSNN